MTPLLHTRRLVLHPLQLEDAVQVQQIFPVWQIVEFLQNQIPWPYPADGVHTYYRDVAIPAIERGDEWHWTLRLASDPDRILGSARLVRAETSNRGFWMSIPWQRQGLMTEASNVITDFWFDTLGFPVLRVSKASPTQAPDASRKRAACASSPLAPGTTSPEPCPRRPGRPHGRVAPLSRPKS